MSEQVTAWGVTPLKRLAQLAAGEGITNEDIEPEGKYPVFGGNGVRGYTNSFTHRGDYPLIGRQGALCGNVHLATRAFWASEHAVVVSPNDDVDARWLAYVLVHMDLGRYSLTAAQPGLAVDFIKGLPVPCPRSRQAQVKIADFLDRETAKIDALIAKQDALLAALDEHRAAAISSAAPKSLAALGWPLDKLGRRTRIGNGSTPSRENLDYWEGGVTPWMNSSVVNQASAKEPSALVTDLAMAQCHLPLVKAGSLLVGLTGQGKTRGMATLTELNTTINQHLAFVEPSERHWVPRFLLWQLRASYGELRRVSDENGSTKGGLTCGDLASLKVAMLPLQLQTSIADKIDRETAGIDAVVGKVGALTGRLRERRAALITAAVTGTLDVTTYGKAG